MLLEYNIIHVKIVLFGKDTDPVLKLSIYTVQYILRNLSQRLGTNRIIYDKIMKVLRESDGETVDLSGIYEVNSMEFRTNPVFVEAIEKYEEPSRFSIYETDCEWFKIDGFFTNKEKVVVPDLSEFVRCDKAARSDYGW